MHVLRVCSFQQLITEIRVNTSHWLGRAKSPEISKHISLVRAGDTMCGRNVLLSASCCWRGLNALETAVVLPVPRRLSEGHWWHFLLLPRATLFWSSGRSRLGVMQGGHDPSRVLFCSPSALAMPVQRTSMAHSTLKMVVLCVCLCVRVFLLERSTFVLGQMLDSFHYFLSYSTEEMLEATGTCQRALDQKSCFQGLSHLVARPSRWNHPTYSPAALTFDQLWIPSHDEG